MNGTINMAQRNIDNETIAQQVNHIWCDVKKRCITTCSPKVFLCASVNPHFDIESVINTFSCKIR